MHSHLKLSISLVWILRAKEDYTPIEIPSTKLGVILIQHTSLYQRSFFQSNGLMVELVACSISYEALINKLMHNLHMSANLGFTF